MSEGRTFAALLVAGALLVEGDARWASHAAGPLYVSLEHDGRHDRARATHRGH